MLHAETNTELISACKILFAHEIGLGFDFLKALDPSDLKVAYRKKALETHPDRSKTLGRTEMEMNSLFKEVSSAYEILEPVVAGKKVLNRSPKVNRQARKRKPPRPTRKKGVNGHYYKGAVPERELKIGQFLYYSGLISWKVLIEAIVWQKRQRPLFGQIAMHWNILSSDDIVNILKEKTYNEKFGEYALRKGYFTRFQHMAVIGRQRKFQPPFGKYFINKGTFLAEEIEGIVKCAASHNYDIKLRNYIRFT